jgi:hypothetical protein
LFRILFASLLALDVAINKASGGIFGQSFYFDKQFKVELIKDRPER